MAGLIVQLTTGFALVLLIAGAVLAWYCYKHTLITPAYIVSYASKGKMAALWAGLVIGLAMVVCGIAVSVLASNQIANYEPPPQKAQPVTVRYSGG